MLSEEKCSPNYVLKFDSACLIEVGSKLLYFVQVFAVAILLTMLLSFNWPSGGMRFETCCLVFSNIACDSSGFSKKAGIHKDSCRVTVLR